MKSQVVAASYSHWHLVGITKSNEHVLAGCGSSVVATSKAGDIWNGREQAQITWGQQFHRRAASHRF